MTKNDAIYATFEDFEEQLAHCYFILHERFIADPSLAKFWSDTAMEELQHASMLRYCRERDIMAEVDLDLETPSHVEQLLDMVQGIVNDPDVTVDQAFYASLLMESSEMDEVYEKLIRALARDHRVLYDAIKASLRSHHDRFADGTEQFCNDGSLTEAFRTLGRSERRALCGRSV